MHAVLILAKISPDIICIIITVLLCLAILIAIVIQNIIKTKSKARIIEQNKCEYNAWRKRLLDNGRLLPLRNSDNLIRGEECYFAEQALLIEPRSVRKSSRGGVAFRATKGILIGGGTGTSESHDEWRTLSSGKLYITSKNIIFDGDMDNRTIKLSTLISAKADPCQIAISSKTYKKTSIFADLNGLIAGNIIKILCRQN